MKAAALVLFAFLAPLAARAVDLRAKSTSSSRQFIIFCEDVALRGRVAGFVEEVKRDVLGTIGQPDRWRIPIVISLEAAPDPTAVDTPVALRLAQTPEGPTIQLSVVIGRNPAAVHLQKHVICAVLLDFMYRDRPPQPGETFAEPPWWIASGVIEEVRRRDFGIESELFQRLIDTNKLPAVADFLPGRGRFLGTTVAVAFDNACAHVLLQLLLDQPEGKARLARLLRDWPDAGGDYAGALTRAFPTLGADDTGLQKWWTLNVARFAASERYRGLSAQDTDRELQLLLEFDVVVDKAGKTRRFRVGAFAEFMRLRGGKDAAARLQKAVIALSARANALLRPVLSDYEQIFALLAKGRTRGIAERIHRAEVYRTAVLQRREEIADYLNWYEATQMKEWSGAFDSYLRLAKELEDNPPMTRLEAQIAAYLDMLEDEMEKSDPRPDEAANRPPPPPVSTPLPR